MKVTRIGLDIAKHVFQVHSVDEYGKVALRKRLTRGKVLEFFANLPRCLSGMEACAGAHHWARELRKLGYEVKLRNLSPPIVKAARRVRTIAMMPKRFVKR